MRSARRYLALLVAACGCHSSPFADVSHTVGPFSTGADVPLTFNADQNYWPMWTEDGRGILYAFVEPGKPSHRCVGLLPAAGGTRLWELCDNRQVRTDTLSSYTGFALDSSGRLLLVESLAKRSADPTPLQVVTLWITDTANPYVRTPLLQFPANAGFSVVQMLTDMQWTGHDSFLALGQQVNTLPHCIVIVVGNTLATQCLSRDTVYSGGIVVRGTIAAGAVTLQPVSGTDGAVAYSLAEGGNSIVFALSGAAQLYRVPATGGAATALLPLSGHAGDVILGVGCRGTTCLYARDTPFVYASDRLSVSGSMELHRFSLASGKDEYLTGRQAPYVLVSPQVSPVNGDVVVQEGGGFGHVTTFATYGLGTQVVKQTPGEFHLLHGLLQ